MNSVVCLHNLISTDTILWRYMDFTKFVSILESQALFFARADKLGDPFEGSVPKTNIASRPILNPDLSDEDVIMYGFVMQQLPRFTLINCWHESDHESEAMWKLYAGVNGGIAIKTNFNAFIKSFKLTNKSMLDKFNMLIMIKTVSLKTICCFPTCINERVLSMKGK